MAKATGLKPVITQDGYTFLKNYINNASPTGFESNGQKLWLKYIQPYSDEYFTDPYGKAVDVINSGQKVKVLKEAPAHEIN